jgi:hypothetical protein
MKLLEFDFHIKHLLIFGNSFLYYFIKKYKKKNISKRAELSTNKDKEIDLSESKEFDENNIF